MKFQDSSLNGLKVTVGTKSVTHPRSKSNMPHKLFQSWGHKQCESSYSISYNNYSHQHIFFHLCQINDFCFDETLLMHQVFWMRL